MSRRKQPFWKPAPNILQNVTLNPLRVMVCVFTNPERHGWVNPELTTTLIRLSYDPRIQVAYTPIHAIYPACAARNTAVDVFLKSNAEVLVLFDNDVSPPSNIADAIVSMPQECNIAVMPYWVWQPQQKHTLICFGKWEDGTMCVPDPETLKPGWQSMGAGGTGCMFIRRKVFTSPDKITEPFFKILSDDRRGQIVSEDIYFTGLAAEAGFPTWTNTDFVCSHYHTVDLAEINLGIVQILNKFTSVLQEKYGAHGVTLGSLIQELHPELLEASKASQREMRDAQAERHPTLPVKDWK